MVRNDLSIPQRAVQAGHAVAAYLLEHDTTWTNGTLVYLKVDNEESLNDWCFKLQKRDMVFSEFREPDIGNEMTALACVADGKVFSGLPLLLKEMM